MKLLFKHGAKAEFIEAALWYDQQCPGLGNDFKSEVKKAIKLAQENPGRFRKTHGDARKIRLKRFHKYSIYIAIEDNVFSVLAVFHASRNPDELKRRLR